MKRSCSPTLQGEAGAFDMLYGGTRHRFFASCCASAAMSRSPKSCSRTCGRTSFALAPVTASPRASQPTSTVLRTTGLSITTGAKSGCARVIRRGGRDAGVCSAAGCRAACRPRTRTHEYPEAERADDSLPGCDRPPAGATAGTRAARSRRGPRRRRGRRGGDGQSGCRAIFGSACRAGSCRITCARQTSF